MALTPSPLVLSYCTENVHKICWAVSNITAGSEDQIQFVIDSGVANKIIDLLKSRVHAIIVFEFTCMIKLISPGCDDRSLPRMREKRRFGLCLTLDPGVHLVCVSYNVANVPRNLSTVIGKIFQFKCFQSYLGS